MPLFGPPSIEKLKAKWDAKGLIKILSDRKECVTRHCTARALGRQWKVTVIFKMTVT